MVTFVLFVALIGLAFWGAKERSEKKRIKDRYRPVVDAEKYAKDITEAAQKRRDELDERVKVLRETVNEKQQELKLVGDALALKSDDFSMLEIGLYEPVYGFEDLPQFERELNKIRDRQKEMLKQDGSLSSNAAAYRSDPLPLTASPEQRKEVTRLLKNVLKLMLRAFNGECDSHIARVNYRNIEAMGKRIKSSFDQINKLAEPWGCTINTEYLKNRQSELKLVFEYEQRKQIEKEEQAFIREQMREEEKAIRDAEKAKQKAEREEADYQDMLERARREAATANEDDKAALNAKVQELEKRIAEIEERKRAISQAMLTKSGHVYIISNIGSFGEDIYKIGMTRRLDPMDRIVELGDASVPFPFDVHAMIFTTNAPTLEKSLHKRFASRRLNLENERKEFFSVSIEEIRSEIEALGGELGIKSELRLTLTAEARQYRLSEARRRHLQPAQ
jgi:flagellar biosynthesis GTPase FlhF